MGSGCKFVVSYLKAAIASPFGSNNNDRRQWRMQGIVVGAAASKMQVQYFARSNCWVPQPGKWQCSSIDGEGEGVIPLLLR